MRRFVVVVLLFYPVYSLRVKRIVGGEPAPQPPEDAPIIFTRFAGKTAQIEGVRDLPHYVFKGLRFAHPPTGKERFLRPRQYFLQGLENATKYPPPCVQPVPGQNRFIGNEDCLFLNVFTPTLPTGFEGLPVIVWIHGGGFRYGSASQYGVRHLVGKQVVVVTIQYRLGSLGFLSTGSKEMPGNAALWDMVLAVQWVRNYIGFFGGNPHKIVVMGHGTGASSAMLVALSNVAKGLPSGVVAMSGTSMSRFAFDENPKDTASEVADINGCPTGSVLTMVRCLQNLSPSSIIRGDSMYEFQKLQSNGFVSGLGGNRLSTAPVSEGRYDGRSLPPVVEEEPMAQISESNPNKIPLLTGVTKDETKRACHRQYKEEIYEKLKTVPNFLDKVLVTKLQQSLGFEQAKKLQNTSSQLVNKLDPLQFGNYLKVKRNDFQEGLSKIAEATADALFNVPAFLSAGAWGKKGAKSFLYRFSHCGKRKKGHYFLKGLPIVGSAMPELNSNSNSSDETVGHGDELAYIFDAHDLEGRSLESPSSQIDSEDANVRDFFTQMIADFARTGKVHVNNAEVKPFSSDDNNFIDIGTKPKVSNNFRYCEMALWCGLTQRLQSSTCSFLKVLDSQIKNLQSYFDTSKIGSNLDPLGIASNKTGTKRNTTQITSNLDPLGLNNLNRHPVRIPQIRNPVVNSQIKNTTVEMSNDTNRRNNQNGNILSNFGLGR